MFQSFGLTIKLQRQQQQPMSEDLRGTICKQLKRDSLYLALEFLFGGLWYLEEELPPTPNSIIGCGGSNKNDSHILIHVNTCRQAVHKELECMALLEEVCQCRLRIFTSPCQGQSCSRSLSVPHGSQVRSHILLRCHACLPGCLL